MIRPITVVTFLMACGSGLYLYQSKHEVQLLDRTIEKSVRDTGALREQSRLLSAEWTMLNDPERLRQFSDTYLRLRTISPAQFTSLNDLDGRLPAPQMALPPPGPVEAPVEVPVAGPIGAEGVPLAADQPAQDTDDGLPVPPIPMVRPAQVATPSGHPIEARVALARPAPAVAAPGVSAPGVSAPGVPALGVAETRPSEPRVSEPKALPRVVDVRPQTAPAPRPIVLAAPRPQPVYAPPAPMPVSVAGPVVAPVPTRSPLPDRQAQPAAPAPFTGSLLGAARATMPPAPRPTPVNATYNAN